MSNDLSPESLEAALESPYGRPFRYFDSVGSTNTIAQEWAEEGAPAGAIVVTDHQTAGKGRWGRTWLSDEGRLLQFSLVLRPQVRPDRLGLLTLCAGVGVSDGIARASGLDASIKWPNDVLLGDRKVAGMLLETALRGSDVAYAIAGIGINVTWEELPDEIAGSATSIATEVARSGRGNVPDRAVLLDHVLQGIYDRMQALATPGLIEVASRRSTVLGRDVTIRFADGAMMHARALRILEDGALEVEADGKTTAIDVGEVVQVRPV